MCKSLCEMLTRDSYWASVSPQSGGRSSRKQRASAGGDEDKGDAYTLLQVEASLGTIEFLKYLKIGAGERTQQSSLLSTFSALGK